MTLANSVVKVSAKYTLITITKKKVVINAIIWEFVSIFVNRKFKVTLSKHWEG